jgi:hypothetical protein
MIRPRLHRRLTPRVTLRQALNDPSLLGNVLEGESWKPWRVLLLSIMGEALTSDERELFTQLTGRVCEPEKRVEEFVAIIGRRGGKSRAISVLATYIAALCRHPSLVAGETGICLVIAADMEQASICFNYIAAAFDASPILRQLVVGRTADTLRLSNGIEIQVRAATFRRLRGPTYVCVVADEAAFWQNAETSSNPDTEILNAVRPGLSTTQGLLAIISSPYARRGVLWDAYHRHYGPNGDPLVLVAQGASRTFNSTLPQSVVDRAMERDPSSANAEYMAQFRTDIEAFISLEAITACISARIYERAPVPGVGYIAFVDPAGGSGTDSMTLCVAHMAHSRETVVIDAIRETRPPFSPESCVADFCSLLKSYRISSVTGDRFGGGWPAEQFGKFGVIYQPAAKPKSELYGDLLPLLNSRRIDLLDNKRLVSQLCGLERRTARSGRDSIDHAPGGHDDIANVVAGVASIALTAGVYNLSALADTSEDDPLGIENYRSLRLHSMINSFSIQPGRADDERTTLHAL